MILRGYRVLVLVLVLGFILLVCVGCGSLGQQGEGVSSVKVDTPGVRVTNYTDYSSSSVVEVDEDALVQAFGWANTHLTDKGIICPSNKEGINFVIDEYAISDSAASYRLDTAASGRMHTIEVVPELAVHQAFIAKRVQEADSTKLAENPLFAGYTEEVALFLTDSAENAETVAYSHLQRIPVYEYAKLCVEYTNSLYDGEPTYTEEEVQKIAMQTYTEVLGFIIFPGYEVTDQSLYDFLYVQAPEELVQEYMKQLGMCDQDCSSYFVER